MIYADYNATTPCDREVAEMMLEIQCDEFANPSNRSSMAGRRARGFIDTAREQVASAIQARTDEILFTSGATESANTIIFGVMQRLLRERPRILTSKIEHTAVRHPAEFCGQNGADWVELDVDSQGRVDLDHLKTCLRSPTALVCVMAANNETGVIQNLDEIAEISHAGGALVFSDMTQLPGKLPIDLQNHRVDLACFSAHKCYGPKGSGAIYKRRGLSLSPLLYGGGQEGGLRSGTENVAGIAGFGFALHKASVEIQYRQSHLQMLTNELEREVSRELPSVVIQSAEAERIPGTSMLSIPGIKGKWLSQLPQVMASSGSACASQQGTPSHVLRAMGVDPLTAMRSVRISLGMPTSINDVNQISQALIEGANKLG